MITSQLAGPIDVVLGKPDGWADTKANEISANLANVERLLWLATGASVLTCVWVVLFHRGDFGRS